MSCDACGRALASHPIEPCHRDPFLADLVAVGATDMQLRIVTRRRRVAALRRGGYSRREIARRLDAGVTTIVEDLQALGDPTTTMITTDGRHTPTRWPTAAEREQREAAVLELHTQGFPRRKIAAELGIGLGTVQRIVSAGTTAE